MTSGQEMERVYSYNPGARTGLQMESVRCILFTSHQLEMAVNVRYSRQHDFFEVVECLLADHDDSELYAQLNEASRRVTLPHTHTHMNACTHFMV